MRPQGVAGVGIASLLLVLLGWFVTDSWLERQMENLGSIVVGARVEFDGVHLDLAGLRLGWNRLQVTDPDSTMKNLFETAVCDLDLDLMPLLEKKILVENMAMEGLQFGTPRKTDGRLSQAELATLKQNQPEFIQNLHANIKKEAAKMPVFNLGQLTRNINVDSIYAMLDLKTPGRIDSLREVGKTRFADWNERIGKLPATINLDTYEASLKALDPNSIKDVKQLKESLDAAKSLRDAASNTRKDFKKVRTAFDEDLAGLKSLGTEIPDWIKDDYQRALAKAMLPDLSVKNVARMLFGDNILGSLTEYTAYIGKVRYYLDIYNSVFPADQTPPRLQGMNIYFGALQGYPAFWIKRLSISGNSPNGLSLQGSATNIVTDQKLIGLPMELAIGGSRADKTALNLKAQFDYRGTTHKEDVSFSLTQLPLNNIRLTDFPLLPSRIKSGKANLEATFGFTEGNFKSAISFFGDKIELDQAKLKETANPKIKEISKRITSAISKINFHSDISNIAGDFSFDVSSNLDNLIAQEARQMLTGEIQAARAKIQQRIDAEVNPRKEQLTALISENQSKLTEQINAVKGRIDTFEKNIDGRITEIEEKIKKETGGKLKDLLNRP